MAFPGGEGALSMGTMVPVFRAPSVPDAQVVVEILEAHAIPALIDSEISALPRPTSGAAVLVPSTMLQHAASILESHELPTLLVRERPELVEVDLAHDAPLSAPLPEPSPVAGRLSLGLGAILLGVLAQRGLELGLDEERVAVRFGARWPFLQQAWRLVTASFLHSGPEHMLANGIFGLLMGVVLFGTHLWGATALTWLVSSIVGLGLESIMSPGALIIGASAGNYGLVGLWVHGQLERSRFHPLPRQEQLRTVGLVLLLVPGALTPFSSTGSRIAVLAHAAGFVAGFFMGKIFPRRLEHSGFARIERRSKIGGGLAVAVVALAVLAAALWG